MVIILGFKNQSWKSPVEVIYIGHLVTEAQEAVRTAAKKKKFMRFGRIQDTTVIPVPTPAPEPEKKAPAEPQS